MKTHTQGFKKQIIEMGRELDSKITYTINDEIIELGAEELNSITPSFQGSILKSVMKQLNVDANVDIPKGTEINYKFGLKVDGEYEYIDFGNYIVKSSVRNEDTFSYQIECYDALLKSMVEYEKMDVTYPISVRDYISKICLHLGLTFRNANDTFVNYDKKITSELYLDIDGASLGYTFRDVLDELAEVTASTICINNQGQLEIRYINETSETINEEFLDEINVKFGEKYGKINSIVLSRSGGSDNIYLKDDASIEENGLCEIKIIDNQIMNGNNRDEFLPEIFGKLNGLEYYLNDFASKGIIYLDLCDRYNVEVFGKTYSCVLLNDEIIVTQGIKENINTEMPQQTETDYTKADKTDRKINQTYLIVDKQNNKIESVVEQTDEQNKKIAKVTQSVDELNSKIGDLADITTALESNNGKLEFDNINQSEPIRIVIKPIGENISYLYPSSGLYPTNKYAPATQGLVPSATLTPSNSLVPRTGRPAQDVLYPKTRTLRFHNKTTGEDFDLVLPDDILYYDSENYDEFILDYDALTCVINKKVGWNADATTYVLDKPTTKEYEYTHLEITDGDYEITLLGYDNVYMFIRLMAQNIYTTQFATKAELNSEITQTSQAINLSVDKKLESYSTTTEMNAKIQISANNITSEVSQKYETKQDAEKQYSKITQTTDNISSVVSKKIGSDEVVSSINQSAEEITLNSNRLVVNSNNFKLTKEGSVTAKAMDITGGTIDLTTSLGNVTIGKGTTGLILMKAVSDGIQYESAYNVAGLTYKKGGNYRFRIGASSDSPYVYLYNGSNTRVARFCVSSNYGFIGLCNASGTERVTLSGSGHIQCVSLTQTSKAEEKKNFELYTDALKEIEKTDIYKYNFKDEQDGTKKHLGFVIGKNYNYSKEITSVDENGKEIGVDNYSMTSLCLQAIKELLEKVEVLENKIKELESDK